MSDAVFVIWQGLLNLLSEVFSFFVAIPITDAATDVFQVCVIDFWTVMPVHDMYQIFFFFALDTCSAFVEVWPSCVEFVHGW